MSRFKIAGTHYVSEWGGNDANAGTDPNFPKATLASVPVVANQVIVVGAGTYKMSTGVGRSGACKIIADGEVLFDCLNAVQSTFNNTEVIGARIINLPEGSSFYATLTRCSVKNCTGGSGNNRPSLASSVIEPNEGVGSSFNSYAQYNSSMFFEGITNNSQAHPIFNGNYVSKNATIVFNAGAAMTNLFTNNCFNGIISRNGINYELKKLFDGSPRPDANPTILDLATISPDCYTTYGNFACVDPEFLDLKSKTVKPTSPLLRRSFGGLFIGSVQPGRIFRLDNTDFQFAYTNINVLNPLAVSTLAGQPFGQIRMTGKVSDTPITFGKLSLRTLISFWKGAAGGTPENNNVPDAVRLLGLPAGSIDKPRRLTYFMRTSLNPLANQASPDAVWDNDGTEAGAYLLHEDGTVPQHAPFGGVTYGNGDPRAMGAPLSNFNFCAVDIIVVLDQQRV